MSDYKEKLKDIHYTWFGLAGLWLLALIPATINTLAKPEPAFSYGPPPSHVAENFFVVAFIAYLAGGVILGKLHNRYAAGFALAQIEETKAEDFWNFHVTPAGRHLPFWLFGFFGAIFLFSIPYMLAGNSAGTFFTLFAGGIFAFLGLQPKLWWRPAPHNFAIGDGALTVAGRSLPLSSIQGLRIDAALKGKSDLAKPNGGVYYQPVQTTVIYAGSNPIAAHALAGGAQAMAGASAAGGKAIAEIANRYFWEMKARSYRVEADAAGQSIVIAEGLDPSTAGRLLDRVQALMTNAGGPP
ncbi:MAG TPA: hypothetical protein VGM68_11870 [Rhizomicrobium sp.]